MCLGIPGQVVEVEGKSAVVEFWGIRKRVSLDVLTEIVVPGDFVLNHSGFAVRVIAPDLVADTLALYEILLTEAGEDPIASDVNEELDAENLPGLVTA
jgi:hydrogenase expression/formation protein HypC